jgi:4-hydroxy-3-polyprenylbenzoate decarboxylase
MGYSSLRQCIDDLEQNGHLVRVTEEVSPDLEMAEIQRRAYAAQAPALFFERVKGCAFPAVCNLFGTMERCRFIFRDTLERVSRIIRLKADPAGELKNLRNLIGLAGTPVTALCSLPRKVKSGPVLACSASLSALPQIKSWPDDGGAFITLPQVYSEDPESPGVMHSNMGMYRIQISGNRYLQDREAGLHYQIHRGIGVHHAKALERGEPLRVSIFVGGPPAHTVAAVMPLPEGLSELMFAGMLGGRRFRYTYRDGFCISTEADFCITGTVDPEKTLPEGPFGDHLGYYSLVHEFPYLKVHSVFYRQDAIWPFTAVGRPPQEDTTFGKLIHEITAPMVPVEIPGLHAMHAVDAAGVHPLLLAIGSERYVPYQDREPMELLTLANAVLGFGQCSLAKYLMIVAHEDNPRLDINRIDDFFMHLLERVDWSRDLHFQTRTTIDTLDYTGTGLNRGSKVVIAAAGEKRRTLATELPSGLFLPDGFGKPALVMPGVMAVQGPAFSSYAEEQAVMEQFSKALEHDPGSHEIPLAVLVDDAEFTARNLSNFLWVTFTRSNPSHDIYGTGSFTEFKHWGCRSTLIIDARLKPHYAPPLIEDPAVTRRVDELASMGGSLHGII